MSPFRARDVASYAVGLTPRTGYRLPSETFGRFARRAPGRHPDHRVEENAVIGSLLVALGGIVCAVADAPGAAAIVITGGAVGVLLAVRAAARHWVLAHFGDPEIRINGHGRPRR